MKPKKKSINLFLITIGFIIWMWVFYKIVLKNDNDAGKFTISDKAVKEEPIDSNRVTYGAKSQNNPFKTPFNTGIHRKKRVKRKIIPKRNNTLPTVPQLKLEGIVSDKLGTLAIIKFPDNSVRFVREKQQIDNITIKSIKNSKVIFIFEGKEHEIGL